MEENTYNKPSDALANEMALRLGDKIATGRAWKDSIERPIRQTGLVPLYYIPYMACVSAERHIAIGEENKQQEPSFEDLARIRRCFVVWAAEVVKAIEAGELPLREPGTWKVLGEGDMVTADSLVFWEELNAWASCQHGLVFVDPGGGIPGGSDTGAAQQPGGRRDRQVAYLVEAIKVAGHDPLRIPYGGKTELMSHCRQARPDLFTESGFAHVWKEAKRRGLIEVENPDQYR